jgi:maleate isomerase
MTDALGTRCVFALLLPATNTITEPDMASLRPAGVSNQTYRFPFPGMPDTLDALLDMMRPTVGLMLECEPDAVIVGYTTEFLPDGLGAARRLRDFVEGAVQRPTTMASDAVPEALRAIGARRIGVVTPYNPAGDANVKAYFEALGFEVAAIGGLSTKGRVHTARLTEHAVRGVFGKVDAPDVEALVQVGTNLVCAGFAADLETQHGKPVIPVNTAAYWSALRQGGIDDRVPGFGCLLERY